MPEEYGKGSDGPCSTGGQEAGAGGPRRDQRLPVLHPTSLNTIRRNGRQPRLPKPSLIMARGRLCVKGYILILRSGLLRCAPAS
jgi:hypothetical protein